LKDYWNSLSPYEDLSKLSTFGKYFYNPELALYMDDNFFGGAVPALTPLRIQRNSLGAFGFGNNQNGLFGLKGNAALNGTALSESAFGSLLLPAAKSPRSVDLWPIFHTGVPNLPPYQLATGKAGNPLAAGKPFINNFLPNGGDMLRLNMAVPPTPRNSSQFSSLGLVQAAVLGLTDPSYNSTTGIQNIPNMDGFPNGRRLEDDVTRIELQAVGGVVLAAIGLWYDDYIPGSSPSPVTSNLINVLTYSTGVDANDVALKTSFPYVQAPFAGNYICPCNTPTTNRSNPALKSSVNTGSLAITAPEVFAKVSPNPFADNSMITYHVDAAASIIISMVNAEGQEVKQLANKNVKAGTYTEKIGSDGLAKGVYFIRITKNGEVKQTIKVIKG
jgi:hypothetical protein